VNKTENALSSMFFCLQELLRVPVSTSLDPERDAMVYDALTDFLLEPSTWGESRQGRETLLRIRVCSDHHAKQLDIFYQQYRVFEKTLKEGHIGLSVEDERRAVLARLEAALDHYNAGVVAARAIHITRSPVDQSWHLASNCISKSLFDPTESVVLAIRYDGYGVHSRLYTTSAKVAQRV
jgi:hypothetical protein